MAAEMLVEVTRVVTVVVTRVVLIVVEVSGVVSSAEALSPTKANIMQRKNIAYEKWRDERTCRLG